jgi:DNA-binding NarL/FixJ family response regulator
MSSRYNATMDDLIAVEPQPVSPPVDSPIRIRVLVVARQPIARAGLRGLIDERDDLRPAGQAPGVTDAVQEAAELRPDAILATWDSGRIDDVLGLAELATALGIPLVVLADAPAAAELATVLQAGVRGVLLADATADDVHAALLATSQGLLVLDPQLGPTWSALVPAAQSEEIGGEDALTDREREVLSLIALGLPNKNIGTRLGISEHTVKFHVGSILSKLGAGSRTEAVTRAARRGLLAL